MEKNFMNNKQILPEDEGELAGKILGPEAALPEQEVPDFNKDPVAFENYLKRNSDVEVVNIAGTNLHIPEQEKKTAADAEKIRRLKKAVADKIQEGENLKKAA